MEEKQHVDLLLRLRSGEKILCPKCGKANLEPYNAEPDKAHSFDCKNCSFHIHCDPIINIF